MGGEKIPPNNTWYLKSLNAINQPCIGTRDRIPCGECRVSGPGQFGSLLVPTVIHAVGPNYALIEGITSIFLL